MSNLTTFPNAPLPSDAQVRARRNLLIQAARFAVLNVKMMLMVTKGHH
jgi:mRNA deadenylase 3'-5' endonuclease subunit Ccr4